MRETIRNLFLLAALPVAAVELEFSGVLGQSQPEGQRPFLSVGTSSAAEDGAGTVWFAIDGAVYRMEAGGENIRKTSLNFSGKLLGDGKDVYCVANGTIGLIYSNGVGESAFLPVVALQQSFRNYAVAPDATRQRFAEKGKFFALDAQAKNVFAWTREGGALGIVLDLAAEQVSAGFESVGIMPDRGYLLVGTGYPDSKVYRYNTNGTQARSGVWPWGGWNAHLQYSGGHVWGLQAQALRYDNFLEDLSRTSIGDGKDMYANGVASDGGGGFYLSTSQGLKHYPADSLSRGDRRIGGCGAPLALALNRGKVIASLGNQLLALNLDDEPDAPFGNTGNEPWHVGGNWDSCGCAIVSDGRAFLILDSKRRTLWRFSPQVENWLERENRMVDLKKTFAAPTDFSYAGESLVFVDDGTLSVANDAGEPLTKVDAFGPDELVVTGKKAVLLLRGGKTVWRVNVSVNDIAVIGEYVAVAGKELQLLDKKGNVVFRSPYALGTLAASGRWLVGADAAGGRILRFKLK